MLEGILLVLVISGVVLAITHWGLRAALWFVRVRRGPDAALALPLGEIEADGEHGELRRGPHAFPVEHLRWPFLAAMVAFLLGLGVRGNLGVQTADDWFGSVVVLLVAAGGYAAALRWLARWMPAWAPVVVVMLMAAVGWLASGDAEFLSPTPPSG